MIQTKRSWSTISLYKVSGFLWFLLIYLLSGNPFQTLPAFHNVFDLLKYCGGFFAIVSLVIQGGFVLNTRAKYCLACVSMIVFTALVHFEFTSSFYWKQMCIVLMAFYVAKRFGLQRIVRFFVSAMFVISIIAIVGYILLQTTSLLDSLPRVININGKEYGIGIVFNYITDFPERNCGAFWEPGIFASYLILAISMEILYPVPSQKHFLRLAVFSVALLTSTSTAGYAMYLACIFLLFVRKTEQKDSSVLVRFFPTLIFILVMIAVLNLDTIILTTSLSKSPYIAKLLSYNLADSARILVISHNLDLFFAEPVFGAGIHTVAKNIIPNADVSTITYMMSIFGLPALVLPIGFARGIFFRRDMGFYSKLTVFSIFIAILSKEPHHNMPFVWILFFAFLEQQSYVRSRRRVAR